MHDPRLPPPAPSGRGPRALPSLFTRILTGAAATLVLIVAVAFSFVVFVIVLTALLGIGLYLWWKTRHFRRQLAEQLNAQRASASASASAARGETIEGEIIRKRDE